MAARRKPRRELLPDDELDEDFGDDDIAPRSRRRRRHRNWRVRFVALLLILASLVVAAPTIVAKTPLRNLLLGSAVAGSSAQLAARDASFSWTGAQGLAGVTLVDGQGNPLATVELISIDRSLVSLAASSKNLGKISVLRPVVHLETREGGSNFEDLTRALADAARQHQPQSPHESGPVAVEIELADGVVIGRDNATGQEWRIDALNATARTSQEGKLAELAGSGILSLTSDPSAAGTTMRKSPGAGSDRAPASLPPNAPGRFKFRLAPHAAAQSQDEKEELTNHRLELVADGLPLAPLEPWLDRVIPGARITGTTSADLNLTWAQPSKPVGQTADESAAGFPIRRLAATGKVDAANLHFTAAALEGDLIEFAAAALAVDATLTDGKLTARQLKADCDWLKADASGEFNLAQLTNANLRNLPAGDAVLTAQVDLPKLAHMLPRTLKLRPGVRIDSGNIEVTARSVKGDAGRRWTIAASIENLLGTDGKRAIRWPQPVEAGLDATESPNGPLLKRAMLRSAFASATAEAVDEGYQGQVEFNLKQLADQLGQFIDMSTWKLAGTGKGEFTLRHTGDDRFVAAAKLDLAEIDVRTGDRIVWVDPVVNLELNANGRRFGLQLQRLDTATAFMKSPRDTLQAELLAPVDMTATDREWSVRIKGDGPLDFWAGRLRPWAPNVPDGLAGAATVNAELRAGPGLVEVVKSQLAVRDFHTRIGDVEIIEPRLEAGGDFHWSAAEKAVQSKDFQLASSTVAARIGGLSLRLVDSGPPTVRGDIAFRGDLERMAAWAGLTGAHATTWPRGQAVGRLQLASDAQRATANITMTATPLTLVRAAGGPASPPAIAWNEPKLEFSATATYANADDRLDLANVKLQGKTVQMSGAGSVERLRTTALVRGDVNVAYDSAEMARLLAGYLGPGVRIEGANSARVQATGRLRDSAKLSSLPAATSGVAAHWSRRWQIAADAGWNAANFYGLPIGQARLAANIRDGEIAFSPLDLAVGEGRITAQPRARLDPPPQEISLPPGPLVSNVAISPEVSDAMLKYAAPMLASATRTEGSFSAFLDSFQMPIGDANKMRASGRLTVHRLAVMPGPMLQDVINLVSRMQAIAKAKNQPGGLLGGLAGLPQDANGSAKGVTMSERTIDVQVVDGRVYHRNLEFLIDDVPVRSYGSVGFDQTLALEIEVPIQAKWVGNDRALQPLIGQVIRIPVSGTFTRWKIDERAIGNFLGQAAQTAVGGAIEGEIGKALDKLFKPR